MQIEIKQIHIDRGTPCECESCPVAQAMQEQLPEIRFAQIGGSEVTMYDDDVNVIGVYRLPEEVARFVRDFDDGLPVHPFSFEFSMDEKAKMTGVYHFCRACGSQTAITKDLRCASCDDLVCLVCGCTESVAGVDEETNLACGWARRGVCTACIAGVDEQENPNREFVELMTMENQANCRTNH